MLMAVALSGCSQLPAELEQNRLKWEKQGKDGYTYTLEYHRFKMSYGPVVKRALPAVVCIEGQGKAAKPKGDDPDPGFGSGVLIDPAGVVLTNYHVVAHTPTVEVTLQDGRKFTSKDIRRDPKSDLAVIKLESKEPMPFLEFGDSDAMEVGDGGEQTELADYAPVGIARRRLDDLPVNRRSVENRRGDFVDERFTVCHAASLRPAAPGRVARLCGPHPAWACRASPPVRPLAADRGDDRRRRR